MVKKATKQQMSRACMDEITLLRQNLMQLAMLHYQNYPCSTDSTENFIKRTLKKYPWRVWIRISVEDIYQRIVFLNRFYSENPLPDGKTLLDVARSAGTERTCDEVKLLILDGEELEYFKQELTFRKKWKWIIYLNRLIEITVIIFALYCFEQDSILYLSALIFLFIFWYIDYSLSRRAGMKEFI